MDYAIYINTIAVKNKYMKYKLQHIVTGMITKWKAGNMKTARKNYNMQPMRTTSARYGFIRKPY